MYLVGTLYLLDIWFLLVGIRDNKTLVCRLCYKELIIVLRVYNQIIYKCIMEKVIYNLVFNRKSN